MTKKIITIVAFLAITAVIPSAWSATYRAPAHNAYQNSWTNGR
jgi:hypothetical protein